MLGKGRGKGGYYHSYENIFSGIKIYFIKTLSNINIEGKAFVPRVKFDKLCGLS